MKNFKKLACLLLALTMALACAACGGSGSAETTAGSDSTATTAAPLDAAAAAEAEHMQIELTTSPVGMHPNKTNDAPSTYVNGQIFETLYRRTVDGTAYEPLLAAEMPEFSDDGLTATIPLRQGVTFQDGTPFTSADVAYMIDSLKDPNYGSQRPSIVESIESYECPDDNTIVLHLAYSDGVLIAKLAHTNGCIVNSALEKAGQDFMVDATGAGTGPFSFVSMVSGATYELQANENYWGGAPEVKQVTFTVVADEATAIARLQTGEADFAPVLSADSYNTISNISGYTAANEPASSIYYLALRSDDTALNPLMKESDFRKVILESVDWNAYCDAMLEGKATHSESIVGPTLVGYTPEMENAGCGYNLEDAKKLVADNGWEGQTVTMLYPSGRQWAENVFVYIQSELSKIGITVEPKPEEWATFLADAKTDNYFDFCILSWSNVTGDGQQMLEPNFSTKNGARVKYNNAEFDSYVDASAKTIVQSEREEAMLKAVQKIQGDNIVRPLYSANQIYCYNSAKYANVVLDKGGQFDLGAVTINK